MHVFAPTKMMSSGDRLVSDVCLANAQLMALVQCLADDAELQEHFHTSFDRQLAGLAASLDSVLGSLSGQADLLGDFNTGADNVERLSQGYCLLGGTALPPSPAEQHMHTAEGSAHSKGEEPAGSAHHPSIHQDYDALEASVLAIMQRCIPDYKGPLPGIGTPLRWCTNGMQMVYLAWQDPEMVTGRSKVLATPTHPTRTRYSSTTVS